MNNKKEIIPGYFVGETVILEEHNSFTKESDIKLGTVGVISEDDDENTLKGWKVVNYEKRFKEEIDKMSPDKIKELFTKLEQIGKINKI